MFSLTKLEKKRAEYVLPGFWGLRGSGLMYTHVSKCKDNKIRGEKNWQLTSITKSKK
jgi:hypothetical protein